MDKDKITVITEGSKYIKKNNIGVKIIVIVSLISILVLQIYKMKSNFM